jgi:GT2 family glycosyltransferase
MTSLLAGCDVTDAGSENSTRAAPVDAPTRALAHGRTRGSLSIVIGIATTGRAAIAAATVADICRQSRRPDRVVVSAAFSDDLALEDASRREHIPVEVIIGTQGSAIQRNAILDLLEDEDVVLFLDDDFLMAPDYLAELERLFVDRPDVMAATGLVLRDGVLGPGLTLDEGRAALAAAPVGSAELADINNGYGCNMAFRLAPIRANGVRFDARLPLYAWLEDVDFSRRLAPHGRIVRAAALRGVHLGVKLGRTSGIRFGYSQIANPIYLNRKGTMRRGHAARMMTRNVLANLGKALVPEPWVDRRGRLRGNLLAFLDVLRRRLDPERVLTLGREGR